MRLRAGATRILRNLPSYLLSDIGTKYVKFAQCFTFRTIRNLPNFFTRIASIVSALWTLMPRLLAPLRKVVARELDVYLPDARNPKYKIYSLVDTLECGHVQDVYLWNGLQDVLYAYSDNPAITAKRHRCQPCASLLATRKQPQSVPAIAAAKTA